MDQVTVLEVSTNVVEVAIAGPQGPTGPQGIQGPPGTTTWDGLTGKPTTLGGFGITDAEAKITAGIISQYWRGDKTWQTLNKSAVGLGNVDNTADTAKPVSTAQQSALDLKVNLSAVGAASGVASLDSGGKVPSAQLPSYVDDVLEYANLGLFPSTGETGKIYVALDTNFEYRWSGSTYIRLVSSPGTTDALTEGTTNLYFTSARVLASVLTGLSTATNAVITASDTVLSALGKLQKQITDLTATVASNAVLTANTFTGKQTISAGASTLNNFFAELKPTDYATGKPSLFFKKNATANAWELGIYDGTDNSGTLTFTAANLALNGAPTAPTPAPGDNDTSIATTAFVTAAVAAGDPIGSVVNSVSGAYTANTTLTTIIPQDNTIPQNTEGDQVISLSITPKSTTNKLRVRINGYGVNSAVAGIAWAIFSSLSANALRAGVVTEETAGFLRQFSGEVEFVPATTSAVTISLRVGPTSGTVALNGGIGAPLMGGSSATTMTVEEIKA